MVLEESLFSFFTKDEIVKALNRAFPVGTYVTTTFNFCGEKDGHCTFKVESPFWIDEGRTYFSVYGSGVDTYNMYLTSHKFGLSISGDGEIRKANEDEAQVCKNYYSDWVITNKEGKSIHIRHGFKVKDWENYCNLYGDTHNLWIHSLDDVMTSKVELDENTIYYLINGLLYGTYEKIV